MLPLSKSSRHRQGLLSTEKYYIPKMEVVFLRGNCPTNKGTCSCPKGVIVLRGSCPKGVVVLEGNWRGGSFPTGVLVLWGSCPSGSCSRTVLKPKQPCKLFPLESPENRS